MTETQLTLWIQKYLSGEATEEEKRQVEQWYESFDASGIEFMEKDAQNLSESTVRSLKAILERISQKKADEQGGASQKVMKIKTGQWWKAAAAALILILGTVYFLTYKINKHQPVVAVQPVKKDIQPGGNKAVLTLGNGQKIVLDSTHAGVLTLQGKTKVIKVNNGLLAYNQPAIISRRPSAIQYNTISTPRGGQYGVVLPDGTKVWLNAASSIRFPTTFAGKERKVQMTGEAYFEVARNASQPFRVSVRGMTVNVLGTHFNIMAYNNETSIKTTLLEGKVQVSVGSLKSSVISRGQQVILSLSKDGKEEIKTVRDANVNEAIAWKNNLFWFDNDNVKEIMKQLSRWYDVDIQIEGNIPDLFTGSMPRNLTFSKVFEVLQKTGSIHYKIQEDKRIVVTP